MNLFAELHKHEAFKRQILDECPDLDETTLHDTLQGCANLEEAIIAVLRSARSDEAHIEALKSQIEDMRARIGRLQARSDKARGMVRAAMEQSEINKVTAPDFTAALQRVAPAVIITDETLIPADYFDVPAPKVSKRLIKKAMDDGFIVPGATLSNGSVTLSVRYK